MQINKSKICTWWIYIDTEDEIFTSQESDDEDEASSQGDENLQDNLQFSQEIPPVPDIQDPLIDLNLEDELCNEK